MVMVKRIEKVWKIGDGVKDGEGLKGWRRYERMEKLWKDEEGMKWWRWFTRMMKVWKEWKSMKGVKGLKTSKGIWVSPNEF